MGHHHDDHHHGREAAELSFDEKAAKLIEHWRRHNDEHAATYRRWADEFRARQLPPEVAALLETAAELTQQINQIFDQAAQMISK